MIFDRARIVRSAALMMSLLTAACSLGDTSATATRQQLDFFEAHVRPVLVEHCYECHSVASGESNGDLLVDSAAGILQGGSLGPALIPGNPGESLLLRVITYKDAELQMPPDKRLGEEAIHAIQRWIEMGAPDPRQTENDLHGSREEKASPLDRDPKTHWAFNPPHRANPPVSDAAAFDPIDSFAQVAAARMELRPNPIAPRETLIRRLYFDLTGLPPTRQQIDRYVRSERPDAYVRLVDKLLASPDFGERFGRHWLDVARYADTVGYALAGKERRYQGSDRFRDWSIRAFATDMPYDDMIRHQLAGDRTDPDNSDGNLDAMGFLTLGRKFLNPLDTIDDRIDVISRGLLGMTVACARCHDHKFDPIPASDYYSLGGIIFSSEKPKEAASPLMLVDKKKPVDSPVLIRGQLSNPGPIAPRQFLTALRKKKEPRFTDGSGRWELAQRIASAENPLTARVMVNRLWAHLIGKPMVDTPSDFGFRTRPPAVPEVLDELAAQFSKDWSIKRLVRRIVLSRIYRQSNKVAEGARAADPDNQFLARANRKRRDFESLRDSMLAVSGSLDRSIGGEPVEITLGTPTPRRTIYAMIDRQNLPALFRTFDFASPDTHSPKRYFTTVPQQALFLLNSQQMHELARRTARVVRAQAEQESPSELAKVMFQQVWSRAPSNVELEAATEFLRQPVEAFEPTLDARALFSYGTARIDTQQAVTQFTPFAVYTDNRWQAAKAFPTDAPYGHAFLSRENGHTPADTSMAVVRRFTAPFAGQIRVRGQMGHQSDKGDGVRTSIWIGPKRHWDQTQKKNNRPYGPINGKVEAGQTIDLVASAGQSDSFDSFYWRVSIRLTATDGRVLEADSQKHFSGPTDEGSDEPLDRLAQLAQTLLMSNEFAFVD